MSSFPYVATSNVFNTNDYKILNEGLTIEEANKLYLSLNDGKYLLGITEGVASASKALVLDSSRNINNINQFTLTGKLVLDQTQSIGFYRNTATLDLNSYIAPEAGNTANLTLYSLRGGGSVKILANTTSGTNPLFLVNATSSTTPSATDYLRILGNGNIGISNNNPAYLLDVAGSINSNTNIQVNRSSNGECFNFSNGTVSGAIHCLTNSSHIGTTTNHGFNIQTNGTNRLSINNAGNITIGSVSSGVQLDLGNSSTGLNTASIQFNPSSLLYKSIIRADTTGGAGIEFYDTQFITPTNRPIINFKTGNNSEPIYFRMCGYLNDNDGSTYPANGCPFSINQILQVSWDSGLRISCINQTQATNNNANVGLWARNSTIPHFIAQDRFNQAHIKPKTADLNSQITGFGVVIGENTVFNGGGINEMRGNATVLNLHNTTGTTSDRLSYTMEHNTTWEMSLGGSAHAVVPNGLYWYNGGYKMVLTQNGRLGVGVNSPVCTFEVSGAVSQTTIPIGTNTYDYNVVTNTWTNNGGGPFTYSICAKFNNDIFVNNQIYCTSDRRLKTEIQPITMPLDIYNNLVPSTYKYKNETKIKIGLIAQDVAKTAIEAVNYTPNENLTVEQEGDIEGTQLSVSYEAITTLNVAVIKTLIQKNKQLEDRLKIVEDFINTLEII